MARSKRELIEEFSRILAHGPGSREDFYGKAIEQTAAHDRMLLGVYALLTGGTVVLLVQAAMSPWAGAALVTAGALFITGLAHAATHLVHCNKMLLLADFMQHGDHTVDLEDDEDELSAEVIVRAEATAKRLQSPEAHYLILGLLSAGAAALIDHWPYAWRAFAVLAGVVVLLLLIELVHTITRSVSHRPVDEEEDEEDDDEIPE